MPVNQTEQTCILSRFCVRRSQRAFVSSVKTTQTKSRVPLLKLLSDSVTAKRFFQLRLCILVYMRECAHMRP